MIPIPEWNHFVHCDNMRIARPLSELTEPEEVMVSTDSKNHTGSQLVDMTKGTWI